MDGGTTWRERILGQNVSLVSVAAGGASGICAVGTGTAASPDGGETWAGGGFWPAGTGSVDFVSGTQGWTTGGGVLSVLGFSSADSAAGSILHTSDGAVWQQQYVNRRHYFTDVDFVDAENGWAVGTLGADPPLRRRRKDLDGAGPRHQDDVRAGRGAERE